MDLQDQRHELTTSKFVHSVPRKVSLNDVCLFKEMCLPFYAFPNPDRDMHWVRGNTADISKPDLNVI